MMQDHFENEYARRAGGIELLAPAKDLECGLAAVDCGADAVYIGAPRFGAREDAGNRLEDIAALARHAHTYWARVYVTVNTLLYDEEFPAALRMIEQLYEIGIDGLIVQDTGLLECDLPPLPLIASTQMHNATPERVAFLEQVGFQRAILARELDLDQIRAIRRATHLELECFIHGSLCVGYSGQCSLSYALGWRSGNRGQCAQPCRKPYTLVDGNGEELAREKHLLCLRDLNQTENLRELLLAGVTSFKIEGRLKDRAYVANVVAHYRAQLDALLPELGLKRSSAGASEAGFTPDVNKTFNRGYTSYFLHGRGERVGAPDTPKMVGEPLGPVTAVSEAGITIDTDVALHNGDGLCFFDRWGDLHGTSVNGVDGSLIVPARRDGIEKGTFLYRNHDHQFLTLLNKSRPQRRIAVTLTLQETEDGLALHAVDEDGVRVEHSIACEKTAAQKPEQALANMRAQLAKCGGTPFVCQEVKIALKDALFVPISLLNALRRDTLEQLLQARETQRPVQTGGVVKNDAPFPEQELTFHGNVLNQHAEAFYRRHGVTAIEPAAESGLDLRGRTVMTTRYCLRRQLGLCPRENREQRPEPLALLDDEGHRLDLRFDCARCGMEVILAEQELVLP